jgi:4-hydroxy-tetrahydrodipicolinate synthase
MFSGLSAFPLSPLVNEKLDERSFAIIIERLVSAGVDSITALGSTGSYAYLSSAERARVASLAVRHAAGLPVCIGVGALRTTTVLENVRNAESAGAQGVLLAPMTYQPLTELDVIELFRTVTASTDLPVVIYDNPNTTRFTFTTALYGEIAALPGIASIKIPGIPLDSEAFRERVQQIRAVIPAHVTIGISGDQYAAAGLNAGCDVWYSVIGGVLPEAALRVVRGSRIERATEAERLMPLWKLFSEFEGSLRVVAAIAESLGMAQQNCLPLPIKGLGDEQRARVKAVITELGFLREGADRN